MAYRFNTIAGLLTALFSGLVASAQTASSSTDVPAEGDPPRLNILWLTVEDMSPWLDCYGDTTAPTPNLDRLASESTRFHNAFATSPVCAPARSSLITGMYATRIGTMHMRTNGPGRSTLAEDPRLADVVPSYEGVPPPYVRCFPELLRAAGYYCTNNGKEDYQFQAPATVWDESSGDAHFRNRAEGQPFFAVFNYGGTHEKYGFPDSPRQEMLVRPDEVKVPPLYPDTPRVRDALARTYNNIAAMDLWVGRHLRALETAGLANQTVVFFFSDHGVGLPRGKRSPYDLGTRVPLLVRLPHDQRGGLAESRVVSFVDFAPTVLSLAGLKPEEWLDGRAFLGPFASEGTEFAFAHADRFNGVYDRARSVTDGRFRYVRNEDDAIDLPYVIHNAYRNRLEMMRDIHELQRTGPLLPEQWQVAALARLPEEFYDSRSDPWEVKNLINDPRYADRIAQLRTALDAWIDSTGDLGYVRPERRLVRDYLWPPDGTQPTTAPARHENRDGMITLTCPTPGVSIGFRFAPTEPWRVYTGPFPTPPDGFVEVYTHRIGWKPRQRTLAVAP